MSDDTPIDPEQVGKHDDLDYAAGYQARVTGLHAESGKSPSWSRGWFDTDRELTAHAGN